ncbi:response regulator transcription factor [Litorilituus lipolyticus]|uniref:Response regulator transcription factor n=1 Tax=Litorilituus lipolyticus TaxID=2491017 RepID=A0A502LA35_9GAMM|nr:response regulator transcription factor [Litorilituus lipolyticus]TPH17117.1 response regulator transcription factor [Litorilituus lipolyticus]
MQESRIIIADDHPLFLEGLSSAIIKNLTFTLVQTASNYLDLFSQLETDGEDLDVLLMDLKMPGANSEIGLLYIRQRFPELPIVILSAHDTIDVRIRCLEHGASEFFSKSTNVNELVAKIDQILNGEYRYPSSQTVDNRNDDNRLRLLTLSQFKVLNLMSSGHTNKQIARELNIAEKTVKNHVSAIFSKLNVNNRTQASNLFNQA